MTTSPAALQLRALGGSTLQLAETMQRSQPYVSQVLNGRRLVNPHFKTSLVEVVGEDGAESVLSLIPAWRGNAARDQR